MPHNPFDSTARTVALGILWGAITDLGPAVLAVADVLALAGRGGVWMARAIPFYAFFGLASACYLTGHPFIGCAAMLAGTVRLFTTDASDDGEE